MKFTVRATREWDNREEPILYRRSVSLWEMVECIADALIQGATTIIIKPQEPE